MREGSRWVTASGPLARTVFRAAKEKAAPMTLEEDRERKRAAFTQEVVSTIAKYLGEDPSLNDYEALVVALQEMSEELAMIENNLMTLADMRGLEDDDIYALTKRAIEAAG